MNDKKPRQEWHYKPALPIQVSPIFIRPLSVKNILSWFFNSWFFISEKLIILGLALISWYYFHPTLQQSANLEIGWISMIYVRNLFLMIFVAGGLHLFFYTFGKQQDHLQYDNRPLRKNSRLFTFNNQVHDNIFWTCASGVTIWTAYEVLLMWSMANGYAPVLNWSDNPFWFVVLFLLMPFWETFYFYWVHRLLHWPPLYRIAHALHHRNTNIGPWSGLSMHPIEHIMYLGTALIHFVVAMHPLHLIFHLQYFTLTAATTHTGFAGIRVNNENRLALGTYHHQLHHRYFECNYGGLALPFDKWFGTFHDGTSESHQAFQKRRMETT